MDGVTIACVNGACVVNGCVNDADCINGPAGSVAVCNDHNECEYHTNVNVCDGPIGCADGQLCHPEVGCYYPAQQCPGLDDNNPCTIDVCNPLTGIAAHEPKVCDSGPPGTVGTCNPFTGDCEYAIEQQNCNDGNLCTIDSQNPINGQCEYAAINCNADNICTIDACIPEEGGCVHTQQDCNDNDPTTTDVCLPQGSGNGMPFSCQFIPSECTGGCNDGNPCTTDSCNMTDLSCNYDPLDCGPGTHCNPLKDYPDGLGFCDPDAECEVDADCDDGLLQTLDSCDGGTCVYPAIDCGNGLYFSEETGACEVEPECLTDADCNNGNSCTMDICSSNGTCLHLDTSGCGVDQLCDFQTGECVNVGGDIAPFSCGEGTELHPELDVCVPVEAGVCDDGEQTCAEFLDIGRSAVATCFNNTWYGPELGTSEDCGPIGGTSICMMLTPPQCVDL